MSKKIMPVLKDIAIANKSIPLNDLRVIYALERAIARIELSARLKKNIIFKGGFVLLKLTETNRFTRDIDALAHEISQHEVEKLLSEAMMVDLHDGIYFGDLKISSLPDQGDYGGIRFYFRFQIDGDCFPKDKIHKLSRIHIDIGFGDYVPNEIKTDQLIPIINSEPSISWQVFPLEYIFAEKIQTVIQRADANSRSKDIFDLILLFEKIGNSHNLMVAINNVFRNRNTPLPSSFFNFIKELDPYFLKSSWESVELKDQTLSFEDAWKKIRKVFQEIDKIK